MAFPTYEALAFSHDPTALAARLAAEVTRRLAGAVDPRVEAANIADELGDLGYPLTTAGYFADRQVYEVRRPPETNQPGLRLTVSFAARTAEAVVVLPLPEPSPLAARLGTFSRLDTVRLLELVRAPAVDLAALSDLLAGYGIVLRSLELDLRLLEGLGLRGWVALHGADLELTTRPVTLFADLDVSAPGEGARLYGALLRFANEVGLPDPVFLFDALAGGSLEVRVEAVCRALGGRLQRLHSGDLDRADGTTTMLVSGLFSTVTGASVEVLLATGTPLSPPAGLAQLADRHRVRIHEGAAIRLPAPRTHGGRA